MKNSVTITVSELKEMLLNWNYGAQPASIQYVTTPSNITPEGKAKFGKVTRIATVNVFIGYKYENSVNNQRKRENELSDFMAQKLWKGAGKRLSTALATHEKNEKFYLSYKKQKTLRSYHFDSVLNFIPNSILQPFYKKSDAGKYQGIAKPVFHREIFLSNIKKLKFRKTTYNVVAG